MLGNKKRNAKKVLPLKSVAFKKGDMVQVTAGDDKGKKGNVLKIHKKKQQVYVQGVRIQTHFDAEKGMQKLEAPVHYSNLKKVDS